MNELNLNLRCDHYERGRRAREKEGTKGKSVFEIAVYERKT